MTAVAAPPIVVLTQDAQSGDPMAERLRAAGLETVCWPLVRITPADDETLAPVLRGLAAFDGVILPSPSAVRVVAAAIARLGIDWPPPVAVGLVGPGSADVFRSVFALPHQAIELIQPAHPPHDAAALVLALETAGRARGARWLLINRPDGRTGWVDALRDSGATVDVVTGYHAEPVASPPDDFMQVVGAARQAARTLHWVVGAASQIRTLCSWIGSLEPGLRGWAMRQPMQLPHPALAASARSQGFSETLIYDDRRMLIDRLQYLDAGGTHRGADLASDDPHQPLEKGPS